MLPLLLNLNYFTPCSSVSIVNFKHVIARWFNLINNSTILTTATLRTFIYDKVAYFSAAVFTACLYHDDVILVSLLLTSNVFHTFF